ncbi:MAG: class I SAM-dependent methyltransferase [Candidatus Omnitrophica bacterium]|nr:class I SAM-dependent methyltransferase [Candidatus Omnitrophota bacterium]
MELTLAPSRDNLASPAKETIREIFDAVAPRYDGINRLLSFHLDEGWRSRAGVGTGKFLGQFLKKQTWRLAAGIDFSGPMLGRARQSLPGDCRLVQADIHDIPFESEAFDLVVSSFTLRSVKDRPRFFKEVRRALRPSGKAAFLCLTRPTSVLGRMLYAPYLKFYLPFIGGLISENRTAYQFLSQSIQNFPAPPEIGRELESAGFHTIQIRPLTFGISTLIQARK